MFLRATLEWPGDEATWIMIIHMAIIMIYGKLNRKEELMPDAMSQHIPGQLISKQISA